MAENKKEGGSEPNQQNDPDKVLFGLSSENCQNEVDTDAASEEETEPSGERGSDNCNENEQQQSYDEKLADEKLGSRDINFAIDTMKKEAEYDEISVKQLFYGFCSAFTKWPIPHTINSRDSGAGNWQIYLIFSRYV